MNDISATRLICTGYEAHETRLYDKIEANSEYQEAQKVFSACLNEMKSVNCSCALEMENSVTVMETVAKDIGFDEGFELGVQLIISCISKGEGFKNEKDI